MVDTKTIRKNLGSRDSIGLKREDVIPLIEAYEFMVATGRISDKASTVATTMSFPSDFDAKH